MSKPMQSRTNSLSQYDIVTSLHPFTDARVHEAEGPLLIARGDGIHVYDVDGREYIEGLAGLWSVAVGFSEPRLRDAALKQLDVLPYYHSFAHKAHESSIRLADKLIEMTAPHLTRVFFTNSGSEANDTVIKLIWYMNNALNRPGKKRFIARRNGYHGSTVGAGSLTCLQTVHRDFDLPVIPVSYLTCPHYFRHAQEGESEEAFTIRLLGEAESLILSEGPETIAAFIGEPLMAAGGVMPPPANYWKGISALCRKYDILLVSDEVINGFGRLGSSFGHVHYDFAPDIVVTSKQLTSSYMPLAAVIFSEDIHAAVADNSHRIGTFGHGFTGSGHPVATAVALENIAIIEERNLIANASAMGMKLFDKLEELRAISVVGDVRGEGLIAGVELVPSQQNNVTFTVPGQVGSQALKFAHEEGLILRSIGDTLALCPPLIVTEQDVAEIANRLRKTIEKTAVWITRNGVQ